MPSGRRPTGRDPDAPARLFVDSGAWIALLSQRDQYHADAERLFRDAATRRLALVTTNLVLAEVHRLTLFRHGHRLAWLALGRMEAVERMTIEFASAADHAGARRWLERLAPHSLTYTDAVSFSVMERTRCGHALAFDEDFRVAGFGLWRG